jgi:hypothetical protein
MNQLHSHSSKHDIGRSADMKTTRGPVNVVNRKLNVAVDHQLSIRYEVDFPGLMIKLNLLSMSNQKYRGTFEKLHATFDPTRYK